MKFGYLITARLKSSRLKEKILLDLNGKSVLDRVIERCKKVVGIDGVVLCTSTNPQDSVLYDYALKNEIKFYSGSEEDVLQRLHDAANYYGFDGFLSITADNPLHSFYCGTLIIDYVKTFNFDFVFTEGVPIGIAPYYLNTKALEIAIKMKNKSNTEIWGPFVNRPDFFNIGNLKIKNFSINPNARITCDYPLDYRFLRKIYTNFNYDHIPSLFEVEDIILDQPELLKINSDITQQSVSEEQLSQINDSFDQSLRTGKQYALEIGHELIPRRKILELDL